MRSQNAPEVGVLPSSHGSEPLPYKEEGEILITHPTWSWLAIADIKINTTPGKDEHLKGIDEPGRDCQHQTGRAVG